MRLIFKGLKSLLFLAQQKNNRTQMNILKPGSYSFILIGFYDKKASLPNSLHYKKLTISKKPPSIVYRYTLVWKLNKDQRMPLYMLKSTFYLPEDAKYKQNGGV